MRGGGAAAAVAGAGLRPIRAAQCAPSAAPVRAPRPPRRSPSASKARSKIRSLDGKPFVASVVLQSWKTVNAGCPEATLMALVPPRRDDIPARSHAVRSAIELGSFCLKRTAFTGTTPKVRVISAWIHRLNGQTACNTALASRPSVRHRGGNRTNHVDLPFVDIGDPTQHDRARSHHRRGMAKHLPAVVVLNKLPDAASPALTANGRAIATDRHRLICWS